MSFTRVLCLAVAAMSVPAAASAQFFDDGYYDDGGFYNDGYNDDGWDYGGGGNQRYQFMPFSPGIQNTQGWNQWDDGGGWNQWGGNSNQWNGGSNQWGGGSNQWGGFNQWGGNYPQSTYRPQPNYQPPVNYSGLPITIEMPPDQSGLCSYSLLGGSGAWNYSITPGRSQNFTEDRDWKIRFDRGNGNGSATYNLRPGVYRFRQSSRGWELYRAG